MDAIPVRRIDAARATARFTASARGRELFESNGYEQNTPIFPAHESETVVSVMGRVRQRACSTAVIAVHFPDRDEPKRLSFMVIRRGTPSDQSLDTGGASTIGMLIDLLGRERRTLTLSVSEHLTIGSFDLVGAR